MKMRLLAATACCALLTGCGGGGGGVGSTPAPATPTPTPTPTPPSSANADLLGPTLLSETFTNDASTGSANYPKTGGSPSITASQANASIVYDATSQRYTLTSGTRTQSFAPSDIDAGLSNAAIAVYVKRDGSTTDSLTLTKAGTSGRFTYKYVAGGFWQRTVDGSSTITGSIDAIAFGVETVSANVPRTGAAAYSIDLIGAETFSDNVRGIAGRGSLAVDFASGQIATVGQIDAPVSGGVTQFAGNARLSSSEGSFEGTFGLSGVKSYSGALNGRFYGPAAQEVGAAFSSRAGDGNVVVGTLVGRQSPVPGGNSSIATPSSAEFFKGDSARLTFDGSASLPVSVQGHSAADITAFYDGQGGYELLLGDRASATTVAAVNSVSTLNSQFYAGLSTSGSYTSFGPSFVTASTLSHVRTGRSYTVSGTRYRFDDVVFGIGTTDPNMPRTGRAGYAVNLIGSIVATGSSAVRTISGLGELVANFANNTITTQGSLLEYFLTPSALRPSGIGTFNGSATITGTAFAGSLAMAGVGNYSGPLKGRFYGPAADEVGAVFSLDGVNGSVATGTLFGAKSPAILTTGTPLAQITTPTDLPGLIRYASGFIDTNIKVTYDPVSATYTLVSQSSGSPSISPLNVGLTAADKDAARSNASYTVYQKPNVDGRLLNPGSSNPAIALTYTSLAEIITTGNQNGIPFRNGYFIPFGSQTTANQMPRSGNGTYTGILIGQGNQPGFSNDAVLTGTSDMTVDFASSSGSARLVITATDRVSGLSNAVGTFTFANGTIAPISTTSPNNFQFNQPTFSNLPAGGSAAGNFTGAFFGPNAAEFGGIFKLRVSHASGLPSNDANFEGAAVGKR